MQPRQESELHGLIGERVGAGDHRLAGDDGGRRGKPDHGKEGPLRIEQVERVLERLWACQQERPLTEIIEGERRQRHEQPGGLDRASAEMAEIGIERLAAGHGKKHRAKRGEPDPAVAPQEHHAVGWIERGKHAGILRDMGNAAECKRDEPDKRDRAEESRDPRRAVRLHREEAEQDQHGERDDIVFERRRGDLQAFDRRQHRDRRRDQGVAIEERGADDAEQDDGEALAADRAIGERHQRERAAFAVIVGAEQDQHIFDGDDQDQRPDDERQDAEDHRLERSLAASRRGMHGFAQGIERARADVAIDDADAAEREAPKIAARGCFGTGAVGSDASSLSVRHV